MNNYGLISMPEETDKLVAMQPYQNAGEIIAEFNFKEADGDVFLDTFRQKQFGSPCISGPQEIGDCVSWAAAELYNILMATEKTEQGNSYPWELEETATEAIYAISRVNVGGGRINGDGSVGAWAMEGLNKFGTVSRPGLAKLGLKPEYSGSRAKEWGYRGLPRPVLDLAGSYKLQSYTKVTSVDQAIRMIDNGYPVMVCSNVGFHEVRDSEGFWNPGPSWAHAMLFVGVKRRGRQGLRILNWWGADRPTGNKYEVQPGNSAHVDFNTADRMLKQGDSFTGSGATGYRPREKEFVTWVG